MQVAALGKLEMLAMLKWQTLVGYADFLTRLVEAVVQIQESYLKDERIAECGVTIITGWCRCWDLQQFVRCKCHPRIYLMILESCWSRSSRPSSTDP